MSGIPDTAPYRRLEADESHPKRVVDHRATWEKLPTLLTVNGTTRQRVETFAAEKRISVEALIALGTRVNVDKQGGVELAWGHSAQLDGREIITALKFRPLGDKQRYAAAPSTFVDPVIIGNRRSLDWFIAEGETDAARLYDLVGDAAAILLLPAGARTFKQEWADRIPRGATVHLCHDADEHGDAGADKAARIIGGRTVRIRPPAGDWCDWDGSRGEFVEFVKSARAHTEKVLVAVTTRALVALPDPPTTNELLGPLVIRGGRLVLGGHTGEGKTTLALQIVRAVVRGEQLLDWTGGGNVRALFIDAEQGLKTIKRRLREAGLADTDHVDYLRVPDGLELDTNEQHAAALEQLLVDGDYGLVVADPLYKLHRGDSNAEREAVDLMRRFDTWRDQYGFALVLPVHCRKPLPGTKFTIHDLFGSSAYVRGAEVVLGLGRLSPGCSRLHFLKDRDGDLPIGTSWKLLFDRDRGYRRDPDDGKNTGERLTELRQQNPEITQLQAAAELGVSDRTIRKYWHEDPDQLGLEDD